MNMKMCRKRSETKTELAYRRICEGEADIARQREALLELYVAGRSAELAEERLREFEVDLLDRKKRFARMNRARNLSSHP
jgi:hypothetical protein